MNIQVLWLTAALVVVLTPISMADIIGSTYDFSGAEMSKSQILAPFSKDIDPADLDFCGARPVPCGAPSSGWLLVRPLYKGNVSLKITPVRRDRRWRAKRHRPSTRRDRDEDSLAFSVNPLLSTTFFGTTAGAGSRTFDLDLDSFVVPDKDEITNVTDASDNLAPGDFSNVHWNGMDDTFTGTDRGDQNAIDGRTAVFDVETLVPEPSSILLLVTVLGGLVVEVKKLRRA